MTTAPLVLYNEIRKGLVIAWGYRANTVIELVSLILIFIFISFFIGQGEIQREQLPATLLGYLVWFYAAIAISSMSGNLVDEASTGTLEQIYMSPMPSWLIFVGRVIATFSISTVMMVVVGVILVVILAIDLPLRPEGLLPFALTMIGLFGFGYAIAGLTLVYKRINAVSNLLQNLLLFLNGALLSVHLLPTGLETIARLLPTTQGIIVLRKVVIDGESIADVWTDGSLVYLTLHSVIFLVVGWGLFNLGERVAKRRGTIGQY